MVKTASGWEEMMEGKIRKRVIKEGSGDYPDLENDILCTVEVRVQGSEELLQKRKTVRYRIGESEAIPALELVLKHMRVGEEAEVLAISRFAWGPGGCLGIGDEKPVPGDADVHLRVHLLDIFPAPGQCGRAEWTRQLQELEWRKTNGNDHFKRQNWLAATRCYERGMEVFSEAPVKPPPELGRGGEAAAATATKTIADISSNLAAVYLSQGRARDALEKAELALDLVPKHEKASYRIAKAALLLGDFEKCQSKLEALRAQQPEDAGVKRLAAELERAQTKHAKKSIDFGKAILEAAGEGREYIEKPPEEPLPSFFQEMLMSFVPTKKQFLVLCLLLALSALAIVFSPQRYRPQVIVASVLGSTLMFAVYMAVTTVEDEMKEEKAIKKKS